MFNNLFAGKRVLVTGHTGFKGSWLSQWLVDLGAEVTGYSLYLPSNPCHFSELQLAKSMHSVTGDILDRDSLRAVFEKCRPEIVFHLAAQPIVSTSIEDPYLNYNTNVIGTLNVLEEIRRNSSIEAGVIITSDKCYENVEWEHGYRENDALGGKDPYSASKACAELIFSSHFRTYFKSMPNLRVASARAGNVIGGGDWAKDRIVPDCAKAWGEKKTSIIRSPFATRPWQHVLEPLSGYLSLAANLYQKHPDLNGQSFNFGPPADVNATVETLLKEIQKIWPNNVWEVESSNLKGKEAGLLKLSCDKALARLSWKPVLNLEETVRFTGLWYRAFYETKSANIKELTKRQIQEYYDLAKERRLTWAMT